MLVVSLRPDTLGAIQLLDLAVHHTDKTGIWIEEKGVGGGYTHKAKGLSLSAEVHFAA